MAGSRLNVLLQQLRGFVRPPDGGLTDAQLLARWLASRDEAAFELLVWRHGPTVLGVCQRLLRVSQDVEDAFQATFLVFLRKAQTIGKGNAVAGWLYQVAYRVALNARQRSSRQALLDGQEVLIPAPPTTDLAEWHDVRPVLDDEVSRLPQRYRSVFVLCCLEGKTNEEAARELGVPIGTVLSRLARARARLRSHLTRRGVTLSAGFLAATGWSAQASASVPACLVVSTMKAALLGTAEQAATAGVITAQAAALTKGALHAMWISKLQTTATALVLSVALIGGGGWFTYGALAAGPGKGSSQVTRGDDTAKENGNAKADEEERQTGNADKEDLRKRLEDATLRARKLERENKLLTRELNDRRDTATALQISNDALKRRLEQLEQRLKELEAHLAGARPGGIGVGSKRTPPSRSREEARRDTSSAGRPDVDPRSGARGMGGSGSAPPRAATPAVEQDARDAVELIQAQVHVKKAELQGAMVDAQSAQRNVARVNALAKSRAISNEEVQAAEDKLAEKKVAVRVKEAEVHEQEVRLRQATRRLEQLRTGKEMQPPHAPAAESQQIQEIRKMLRELERKLDSLDRTGRPSAPPASRR
jgi:RNA polymerase sigma factor (sigma-70 family)